MLLRICLIVALLAGLGGIYFANVPVAGKIKSLTTERDELQTAKKTAEDQARTAKASVASARTELEKVTAELAQKTTDLENQTRIAARQQTRADASSSDATRYLGEKNRAENELEKWRVTGLDVTNVLKLDTKLKATEKERDVFRTENEIIARQARVLKEELAKLSVGARARVELPVGLTGSVVNVDPKFDFVVLNIGTKNGVLKDGELIVARNGKYLAKVRVTGVEPDRSIADVIAAWKVAEVMEGDQVLAER